MIYLLKDKKDSSNLVQPSKSEACDHLIMYAKKYFHVLGMEGPSKFILVDVNNLQMHLVESDKIFKSFLISVAKNGLGEVAGSGKTPLGLHKIVQKYSGSSQNSIFEGRVDVAQYHAHDNSIVYNNNNKKKYLDENSYRILTGILRLSGMEFGKNFDFEQQNECSCDSFHRYIYIHAITADEIINGKSRTSSGCIEVKSNDMMFLLSSVIVGAYVLIIDDIYRQLSELEIKIGSQKIRLVSQAEEDRKLLDPEW